MDGSIGQPAETDPNYLPGRGNKMMLSRIINAVSKEISDGILYTRTRHDTWNELRARFCQSDYPRVFQLKQ